MLKTSRLRISPPQGRKPSSNEHFSTHKPRVASQLRFPHPAKVRHSCMVAVVSSAETGQSRTHARIIIKCSGHPFKPPQRPHSRRKRSRCRLSSTFVGVAKSASEPRPVVWESPQPVGEGGPVLDQQEEEEDIAQKSILQELGRLYFLQPFLTNQSASCLATSREGGSEGEKRKRNAPEATYRLLQLLPALLHM